MSELWKLAVRNSVLDVKSSEITDLGILYLFEQKAGLLCYLPIPEISVAGKAESLSISILPRWSEVLDLHFC